MYIYDNIQIMCTVLWTIIQTCTCNTNIGQYTCKFNLITVVRVFHRLNMAGRKLTAMNVLSLVFSTDDSDENSEEFCDGSDEDFGLVEEIVGWDGNDDGDEYDDGDEQNEEDLRREVNDDEPNNAEETENMNEWNECMINEDMGNDELSKNDDGSAVYDSEGMMDYDDGERSNVGMEMERNNSEENYFENENDEHDNEGNNNDDDVAYQGDDEESDYDSDESDDEPDNDVTVRSKKNNLE